MVRESCICGKDAESYINWKAWKLDWGKITPLLSQNSSALLKSSHICNQCKESIKNEIREIIS